MWEQIIQYLMQNLQQAGQSAQKQVDTSGQYSDYLMGKQSQMPDMSSILNLVMSLGGGGGQAKDPWAGARQPAARGVKASAPMKVPSQLQTPVSPASLTGMGNVPMGGGAQAPAQASSTDQMLHQLRMILMGG